MSRNRVIALVVAFALVAGAVIGAIVAAGGSGGSGKTNSTVAAAASKEVFAEPVSTATNPFSPPAGKDYPNMPAVHTNGPTTQYGGQPGLYGGTMDRSSCDKQLLVNYLQANVDKATAWAATLGIQVTDIPSYVNGLTPVLLRSDTRVTNHGYASGRATSFQAVLQAGTAVLVDDKGEPVTKCYCGNPLTPPVEYPPVYAGPKWPGFDSTSLTVIVQNTTIVNTFTLVDPVSGTSFQVPAGGNGVPPTTTTTTTTATTTTTSTTTTTLPSTPTTQAGPTDEQRAKAKLDTDAQACYPFRDIQQDTLKSITYSAGPDASSFILTRIGSLPDGSTQTFMWQVDRRTLVFTPLNDLATRANNDCPAFGSPG